MEDAALTRIAMVAASEITVKAFLRQHLAALAKRYSVCVMVDTQDAQFLQKMGITAELVPVAIARQISPLADLRALFRLTRLFRSGKYDLAHSVTPKAGLLAMIAGRLAGVPLRLHTFTGQVWVTRRGPMRALLRAADRLIARMATHVLVDSHSQRDFLVAQGIAEVGKTTVIGKGSIGGVDTERFRPDPAARQRLRAGLGVAETDVVFLYLGRLKRDKGVLDLARAFADCGKRHPSIRLLLVGPDEDGLEAQIRSLAGECAARLHCVPYTDQPQEHYAAADIFCLPSYREGFGSAILEAAAAGLPAIGSRIYGVTDAILEGSTGLLFEAGNCQELAAKMESMIQDEKLCAGMGKRARERALREFSAANVTAALLEFYASLLQNRSVS